MLNIKYEKKKVINVVILLVAFVAIIFCSYFYYKLNSLDKDSNKEYKTEVKSLLEKVSKLYLVPIGEEPTVATVSDPDTLKSQQFLIDAEKGDKVLIFIKAGKAVLYRPSIDKIIETAPIKSNTPVSTSSVTSVQNN